MDENRTTSETAVIAHDILREWHGEEALLCIVKIMEVEIERRLGNDAALDFGIKLVSLIADVINNHRLRQILQARLNSNS